MGRREMSRALIVLNGMSDPRNDLDRAVSAFGKLSLLAQLRDKVVYAEEAFKPRCGDCEHWMKSNACPREHPDLSGYRKGPSCNAPPCAKFQVTQSSIAIARKRTNEAIAFAQKHDLPMPEYLVAACWFAETS
jgi:hypothetical protein